MMSKQEILNKVSKHLLAQGKRAMNIYNDCVLMNSQGLKCAVGCLIPDGHPGLKCDGGVVSLFEDHKDLRDSLGNEAFLESLQNIHDIVCPGNWQSELEDFATKNNLDFNTGDQNGN